MEPAVFDYIRLIRPNVAGSALPGCLLRRSVVQVDRVRVRGRACRLRDEEGLIGDLLGWGMAWAQGLRTGARAVYLDGSAAVVVRSLG